MSGETVENSTGPWGGLLRDANATLAGAVGQGLSLVVNDQLSELAGERNVPDRGDRQAPAPAREGRRRPTQQKPSPPKPEGLAAIPMKVWYAVGAGVVVIGGLFAYAAVKG